MNNDFCISCPRDNMVKEGNCIRKSPDGHVVRCGPPWTIKKHRFVEGYCEIVTAAMRNRYSMNFIDLFSGPGLYYKRTSGELFEGSPIIASKYGFDKLFFIDLNYKNIEALKIRLGDSTKIKYFNKNANQIPRDINAELPDGSLSFCLADPDNMRQLQFATLRDLTHSKKVDLLINFPYGNAFKRGAKNIIKLGCHESVIDFYFNTKTWQEIFIKYQQRFSSELFNEILNLYLKQFYDIGYEQPAGKYGANYQIIKNTRNREIYFLIFLSKHQLGYKFWSEIVKYTRERNLDLPLS